MARRALIITGLVCAVGSLACAVAAWQQPPPFDGLASDQETKSFGEMEQQAESTVAFELHNYMKVPVEIVQVINSCTCAGAELADRQLASGQETTLTARIRPKERRGQLIATVDIVYRPGDAEELRRLSLTITGMVNPHYTLSPEQVAFKLGAGSVTQRATVTIAPTRQSKLRVLEAYATHPSVQVASIKSHDGDRGATIEVTFDPARCVIAPMQAMIMVRTDSPVEPIYRLPVSAGSDPSP